MQVIISALHFDWETLPACLARAAEWGLAGVELSWHPSFARPHCTCADLEQLAALPAAPGSVRSAHIWEDPAALERTEARSALLHWLETCRRTGTTRLVLHGGSWPDQRKGVSRLCAVLCDILPVFERAGVVLHLENHYAYTYHSSHELLSEPWEFALLPESPALRWCYDTGHGNMTGNADELLRAMGARLAYIHLADNLGVNDDHLAYARGTVPWGVLFDRLQTAGFSGIMCVEFPVREDRRPFEACLAELRRRWPDALT